MKRIFLTAAFSITALLSAQAQSTSTPEATTPSTETTFQKAMTGIPYPDQMNYATMTYEQVPNKVRLSFGKAYPNANNPTWESNEYGYRTSFQQQGRSMSVRYDLQGQAQEVRTGIGIEDLPLTVRNQLQGKEANLPYEIKIGNETFYSAQVGGQEQYYDKTGKALKRPEIK